MRAVLGLIFFLLVIGGAVVLAFRSGILGREPVSPEPIELTPTIAVSAERKLARLGSNGETARLTEAELASLLQNRPDIWSLGGATPPRVTMRGDTLRVSGAVPVDRLPDDPAIDAIRMFLPDTAQVDISGTVSMFDERTLAFNVATVDVSGMPIPARYVPIVLGRLGLSQRDDLPAESFAVPLPPDMGSVSVDDGELVITP